MERNSSSIILCTILLPSACFSGESSPFLFLCFSALQLFFFNSSLSRSIISSTDLFSLTARKLSLIRWRRTGLARARVSSADTLYRPCIRARTLPAPISACAARGLAPKRMYSWGENRGAPSDSGCVPDTSRTAKSPEPPWEPAPLLRSAAYAGQFLPIHRLFCLLFFGFLGQKHDRGKLLFRRKGQYQLEHKPITLGFGQHIGAGASCSMGFSVARTKKGSSNRNPVPPTVTACSCMASNSADWVLGVARFISSARRMLLKTGPFRKTIRLPPCSSFSSTWVPVTSAGIRSGVNWIRPEGRDPKPQAEDRTNRVFPTPGTPFQQHISAGKNGDHRVFHRLLLAQNVLFDLRNRSFGFSL